MTQIADNLMIKASIPDIDLRLIDAIWDVQKRKAKDMRPSDRLAIRQSFAAVERLGARLIALMGADDKMKCRVLPQMTQTTRVRKAPKRIWLEITRQDVSQTDDSAPVLFLEFARSKVNVGLHVPDFASDDQRKHAWDTFRKHKPQIFRGLKQKRSDADGCVDEAGIAPGAWALSKCRPPEGRAACTLDVKDWVKALSEDTPQKDCAVSVSASIRNEDVRIGLLEACLSEAVVVFAPFLETAFEPSPIPVISIGKLRLVDTPDIEKVARSA